MSRMLLGVVRDAGRLVKMQLLNCITSFDSEGVGCGPVTCGQVSMLLFSLDYAFRTTHLVEGQFSHRSPAMTKRHRMLKAFWKEEVTTLLNDCDGSGIHFGDNHRQTIVSNFWNMVNIYIYQYENIHTLDYCLDYNIQQNIVLLLSCCAELSDSEWEFIPNDP